MLVLLKENPLSLELDIADALTSLGIASNEVTDISFMVKANPIDADNLAKLNKTLVGGGITLSNSKFYVNLVQADYSNLVVGTSYYVGLGLKYGSLANFLELELDDNRLEVKQDVIRA